MGWDGTGINCYGMEWDGTEKYVPWTSLAIAAIIARKWIRSSITQMSRCESQIKNIKIKSSLCSWYYAKACNSGGSISATKRRGSVALKKRRSGGEPLATLWRFDRPGIQTQDLPHQKLVRLVIELTAGDLKMQLDQRCTGTGTHWNGVIRKKNSMYI